MTDRVATTLGLFPRPDGVRIEGAREAHVDAQREAGLGRTVEGQAGWTAGLAHPLAVHGAVEANDLRVAGDLTFDGTVAAELDAVTGLLAADEPLQAVLPGPYTLASLATDDHYGDGAALLAAVAEFLAAEVAALPAHETLFLLDPALVTDPPGDGMDERASAAVDAVAAATDAAVVLQSWRAAHEEKVYAHLMDADVDAFGFDFVAGDRETHLYNVTEFGTKDSISLGLVDGRESAVENPKTVAERVDWALDRVPSQTFETTYVTPTTGLAALPRSAYREKLGVLGAVGDD